MCGISGIVDLTGKEIESIAIQQITDLIKHRGPNDVGYFHEGNIAFGHRRLSILDLSEAGHQPMEFQKELVIVYNGEVYNYLEIKAELIQLGYSFKGGSDTEVILASYKEWGEDCVKHFNGMWAFAIFDRLKNIIFCSRDRFGVKPFYYSLVGDFFVFGSEIKQILSLTANRIVNKKVLMDYLVFGLEEHSKETFFKNVKKLMPSNNLILDLKKGEIKEYQYYSIAINPNVADLSQEESAAMWKKEFDRAVSYRLRSDVKVGTCLSGGLDSSSIAAVASQINKNLSENLFVAITAKSEDASNDESHYAKKVVDYCNLDWHLVTPKLDDFKTIVDKVIDVQEEPFGSPSIVMQYFVFKKSKEIGCTVLLDGQGGDETLLGYERYYPAYLFSLPFVQKWKAFFQSSKNSKLSKKDLLLYWWYFTNSSVRIKRQFRRFSYLKKEFLELTDVKILHEMAVKYQNIQSMQLLEVNRTQLPHLLKYEDKNSMFHSIETRLPFLDYQLVELSLSINNKFKIKEGWTKYILRKALHKKLPEEILWRKNKFGFEAPTKIWLKDKKWFFNEINNSNIVKNIAAKEIPEDIDSNVLWKLYNIARWEKLYNVEIE